MTEPTMTCSDCGTAIDEPPDQPINARKPCPNCGSTKRTIHVSLEDRLNFIGDAFAVKVADSDRRIDSIIQRAGAAQPTTATGTGSAADATVETVETAASQGQGSGQAGAMI